MKKTIFSAALLAAMLAVATPATASKHDNACPSATMLHSERTLYPSYKVPITGRKQRLIVSDADVLSLSSEEYTKYMKTAKKSTNATNTAMVQRVGKNLAKAVETYLSNNGYKDDLENFSWEFNLVQEEAANAFCMPGGKIVVYEGLLPITQNESALAVVLGHEIAHAVARHSQEQLSTQKKQKIGAGILGAVLGVAGVGDGLSQLAQTGFGLGAKFSSLKYSRDNESEADHIGLVFAAMAGYDPNEAVTFWQRMASSSSSNTPAFLSDHPSDEKRIKDIQQWLPEAQKYYTSAKKTTTTTTKKTTTTSKKTTTTSKKTTTSSKKKTTTTKKK